MNAVIAPFKEPLPCQDTMEWPFCDCKPLLEVNHGGQSHGLVLYTAMCCCNSNYAIQQHWYFLIYFKGHQSMLFLLKQDSVLFLFLAFHAVYLFESFWCRRHTPWLSARIFTIWLFFERVTVFDTVVWITNLLWKSFCDVRVHRKCNFNA